MSPIPDDVIEQVRDAADIVSLIGEHVDLRRTGADYRGPCPFHGGTHRNFAVIPKKGMFYCFVCHEAGDIFTFFMKKAGMEYPTAVREVARRVGITIPERPSAGPDPREPLFSAVSAAAEWYARRLREAGDAKPARDYLATRRFDAEALLPHGLGYAPKGTVFLEAMQKLGIDTDVLREAGLAVARDDESLRPRFWNRLLFPIHDLRGRVVGFGGRVIGEGEPKYLNSPESPIFHKGHLLYGLHEAKHEIRKTGRAVVVEGYFDVLRLAATGVAETVAPLGTSLTADQATLLKRYAPEVVLFYDSDAAGLRASFRAADVLLHAGLRVAIATPPPGQDPDTLALEGGAEAVRQVLGDALDVLERKVQLLERKGWLGSLSGRRKALDRLLPTLRAASDSVTRDLYVSRTAEALGVSRQSVEQEMAEGRWHPPASAAAPAPAPRRERAPGRLRSPERDLVRVMLHEPEWRGRIDAALQRLAARETPAWRAMRLLARADASASPGALVEETDDGEVRSLLTQLAGEGWGDLNVDAIVDAALRRLESAALEEQLEAIDRKIPVATDEEKVALLREKDVLSRKIAQLNPGRWNVIKKRRSSSAR